MDCCYLTRDGQSAVVRASKACYGSDTAHHEVMAPLRPEERWAMACIQHELPAWSVGQYDDGSQPGMYDLKIVRPDGAIGAVEVTAAHDKQRQELLREIRKRATSWQVPGIAGGWIVRIRASARARELHKRLPELLQELEHSGRTGVRGSAMSMEPFETQARTLGVIEARQSSTDRPGSIYVLPPEGSPEQVGGFAPPTGDPLAEWLKTWLADPPREDNIRKLEKSGAPERHIFVLIPSLAAAPFPVFDLLATGNAPLPTIDPELPVGITHVWAMSTWIDWGDGIKWSPDRGWTRFVKVTPP